MDPFYPIDVFSTVWWWGWAYFGAYALFLMLMARARDGLRLATERILGYSLAALYLGMRANFDPSIGPARLLYAFEAVIIGGLGSLWGTLAGGIVIGMASMQPYAQHARLNTLIQNAADYARRDRAAKRQAQKVAA